MIMHNYLRREVYSTTFAVTGILLAIFLSNQWVHLMSRAAAGKLPTMLIFKLLLIQIPYLASLLLPLGFFFGILLAFGRLYVDNEMTVLSACGYSPRQLLKTILFQACMLALLVGSLTIWVCPELMAYRDKVIASVQAEAGMQAFVPGRFQASKDGKHVVYVDKISRNQAKMEGVFVAEQTKPHKNAVTTEKSVDLSFSPKMFWQVMKAVSAHRITDPKTQDEFLVAEDGFRYSGIPGNRDFRMVHFKENGLRINHKLNGYAHHHESAASWGLMAGYFVDPHAAAEMQWRFSMPLSVVLLSFVALSLCKVKGRQGKYLKLLPAILLYTVYANMLFVARSWVAKGKISIVLGMWWWHCAIFILGLILWFTLMDNAWRWRTPKRGNS